MTTFSNSPISFLQTGGYYQNNMNIDNSNIPFADKVQLLTIRDQLAAAALTGLIANANSSTTLEILAKTAYEAADAMLVARAK